MFDVTVGVRQGDVLSPTLFSLYVNDLAEEINSSKCGVQLGDDTVGILMYADDVCLLAENEVDLLILCLIGAVSGE